MNENAGRGLNIEYWAITTTINSYCGQELVLDLAPHLPSLSCTIIKTLVRQREMYIIILYYNSHRYEYVLVTIFHIFL